MRGSKGLRACELVVPAQASAWQVIGELNKADATLGDTQGIDSIQIVPEGFLRVSEIALITAWAREKQREGFQLELNCPNESVINYWERMKALELMNAKTRRRLRARPTAGRFVEMHEVTSESIGPTIDAIMDVFLHAYIAKKNHLEAVEWILAEMLANVDEHSEDSGCAVAIAQRYEDAGELELAVVDRGIGLTESLSHIRPGLTDQEAVELAVEEGVSGKGSGRGNGLAGTAQIARVNGGRFLLLSGTAMRFQVPSHTRVLDASRMKGTYASVSLRLDESIDFSRTLIGDLNWTFVNSLLSDSGGLARISVKDKVDSLATRRAAERFSIFLINLLNKASEPVLLDFKGSMPSSAFIGELFKKLEDQMPGRWQESVVIGGLRGLATAVVNRAAAPYGGVQVAD